MAPSSRMAEYRRHVHARHAPVVATVTTPEADAACARCGVRSFADLLRPFADVSGLNVPMRHNAEAPPYVLAELSIRFHGVRECCRAAPEAVEAYARRALEPWDGTDDAALARTLDAVPREMRELVASARACVDEASPTFGRGFVGDGSDAAQKLRSCEGENEANLVSWFGTPWFDRFARRAARRCAFSDFETTDHPRAVLFATALLGDPSGDDETATVSALVEAFSRMRAPPESNPEAYPEPTRRGAADPDVAAHFVVLHAPSTPVAASCLRAVSEALSARRAKDGEDTALDAVRVSAVPILPTPTRDDDARGSSSGTSAAFFAANAEARLASAEASASRTDASRSDRSVVALGDGDIETLRAFVRAFATETLLPHMERRLAALNRNIASTRKGLKNQLKTFWGRNVAAAGALGGFGGSFGALANGAIGGGVGGGGPGAAVAPGTALEDRSDDETGRYSYRSPEKEIRLAADLAFSLRDHETAAHHYRLLQSDFKADRAYRHLACAHESLAEALACVSSGDSRAWDASSRREIDAAFDAAVAAHRKLSAPATAPETSAWTWRVSHSRAVFLASAGAHRDAARTLATMSSDECLSHHHAACASEAAAFSFLRAAPPLPRKFAMHAVLAGHRFAQAGFRAHAVRCYASALPVYETPRLSSALSRGGDEASGETETASFFPDGSRVKTPWARAREHLHFALGRQITKCGTLPSGVAHFEKLLRCADGVSAAAQETYVREFLFVEGGGARPDEASAAPPGAPSDAFLGACLPEIDAGDVIVSFEDDRATAAASAASVAVSEETWRALESDGVVPARLADAGSGGATWLNAPSAGRKKKNGGEQTGVCAAGETVFVETRFRNPLAIPIAAADVSLRCAFETSGDDASDAAADDDAAALVSTPATTVTLRPLETRRVRLACVPRREGTLRVLGVSWRLCVGEDSGTGARATQRRANFAPFDVRAARARRGADGVSWVRDVPREKRLALRVTPAMPRLECRVLGAPASMPVGAVAKLTLVARNVARRDAARSPDGLAVAALRVRVRSPGEALVALADASAARRVDDAGLGSRGGGSVFEPAAWRTVRPGEEVSIDLYARPTRAGALALPFVVCYEPPEPAPPSLRFRVSRVAATTRVTPGLDVSARVSDAAAHPAARVVRVAARNVSGSGDARAYAFRLRAVRLLPAANAPSETTRPPRVFLRPAVGPNPDIEAPRRHEGLDVAPAEARDIVLTAGPAEAFGAEAGSGRTAEPRGIEPGTSASSARARDDARDVVSYVGDEDAADAADAAERFSALARLLRASSAAAVDASTSRRDASRREPAKTRARSASSADATADRDVAVEWEAIDPTTGERAFLGAHFLGLGYEPARSDAVSIRWTMDGPPRGVSTIPSMTRSKVSTSVSARFALRVHNPSPSAARVTFESTRSERAAGSGDGASAETSDEKRLARDGSSGWALTAASDETDEGRDSVAFRHRAVSSLPPGPPWLWTGPVTRSAVVPSGATETMDLVATAFAPGVFSLGEYRLVVEPVGGGASRTVATPRDASDAPFAWIVREEEA